MADAYLAMSQIANDSFMNQRVMACAAQQQQLGAAIDSETWVWENRFFWASSPSWGEKWDYAHASHPDEPGYQAGADPAVITDQDILTTVQALIEAPVATQLPA